MRQMWDQRYSEEGFAYGTEPNEFLVSVAGRIQPGRVLCLGEGEGRNAVYLAEQGYDVTAVDSSGVGLANAQALAAGRSVSISTVQSDLAAYGIAPETWSAVVSIFCHVPPPLRALLHRKSVEGLIPKGVLVLEGFTPKQLELKTGGPPSIELMVELDILKRELAGLEFKIGRELERPVLEGRYHHGRAAVVQVFGVKP